MKNILVVNINWLGDAIFSVPVFKALKKAYPQAQLTCLCVPRVKEVLDYCPYVDKFIIYDERKKHRWPWQKLKIIGQIRAGHFDAAFVLHRSMTRALLVFLAGIPVRVGYSKTKWLLTQAIDFPTGDLHRGDVYLKVVEDFGVKVDERGGELSLKLPDMKSLDVKLAQAGVLEGEDFVVFNPGGNWDLKRWPVDLWAQLAAVVNREFKVRIVISGGAQDKHLGETILHQAGIKGIVLAGQSSLGESLALFKRARVVVSADSGPLHLAQSVGAKVIAIFGPTRPEITGPRAVGAVQVLFHELGCNKTPCYLLSCKSNLCMQAVKVSDVAQAIKEFFN